MYHSSIEIPPETFVYAWIPFAVVVVGVFLFALFVVSLYKDRRDSAISATICSSLGVGVALLLASLAPVDIFLVSFMKNPDGGFKDWVKDNATRVEVEAAVSYAYVVLFVSILLFLFFVLPFVYFFYEENDDEVSTGSRCCTAFKYSLVSVALAVVLLLTGAFLPMRGPPSNATSWEKKLEFLVDELGQNRGEDTLAFSVNIITILGTVSLVIYTAFGMSAMPMDLIKGRQDPRSELEEVKRKKRGLLDRAKDIRDKYFDGRNMGSRDQRRLREIEENEALLEARERQLASRVDGCLRSCIRCCRPFRVAFGIIFLLISATLFASLLIGNVDKALNSLGPRMGYALPQRTLPNPVDVLLQYAQAIFPLDYIIILIIVVFLFLCSVAGIREIGVWCLCFRAYKVRPRNTKPQALLFLAYLLMYIVLGINILLYFMAPMYAMYGNQFYVPDDSNQTTTTSNRTHPVRCTTDAPPDQCILTRMGVFLSRYFFKTWFFGACYYWAVWVFCAVFVIGFGFSLLRPRKSAISGLVDSEDFEESEDEGEGRRRSRRGNDDDVDMLQG